MNSSLYIGASGMKGLSEGMQVTTNNLANVSTIGFKQQDILFSDVMYQTQATMGNWWNAQDDSRVAVGQVGQGLQVEAVRTKFIQGGLESTNTMTDLAINGKGFFQVTDGVNTFYTRAGDFREDSEGVWRTPSGLALNGFALDESGNRGALQPVQVDKFSTIPPKATSSINLSVNLSSREDVSVSESNPFFSLVDRYDARQGSPISSSDYTSSMGMTVYDAQGAAQNLTVYFDGVASQGSGSYTEFLIAADSAAGSEDESAGMLMSGVLHFDSDGNLVNVSAYTPSGEAGKELSGWTAASMTNGNPTLSLNGSPIEINFGLSSQNGWDNATANAAEIGSDISKLAGLGSGVSRSDFPSTAYNISSMVNSYNQDGYNEGFLSNVSVSTDGVVTGYFSNGESRGLYEIPLCRFTSEDGLRREGGNLFSAGPEAGVMEMGTATTENYGEIMAYNIESSNVDMAQEMINMIINQRGFQSNSKVVTTADQLLQKAMELKR